MTVITTDIPVLHSIEVVPFAHKSFSLLHRVVRTLKHFQGELARVHYESFTKFH
jgi:hypothetical protein